MDTVDVCGFQMDVTDGHAGVDRPLASLDGCDALCQLRLGCHLSSPVGPASFQPLCHGHLCFTCTRILMRAIPSRARAIDSGPTSMGRNPIDFAKSSAFFLASSSSPATKASRFVPSTFGSAILEANA